MAQERRVCAHCGKYSGLDDLVHNALALGLTATTSCLMSCSMDRRIPVRLITCSARIAGSSMMALFGGSLAPTGNEPG